MDWSLFQEQELKRLQTMWESFQIKNSSSAMEVWDAKADHWESGITNSPILRSRSEERIKATADFLRVRGLLGPNDDVIDVGCGPGRFVAEFAKTANHVVGTDISPKMLEHGAAFARNLGLVNTSYTVCDFLKADLLDLGWENRFDLVFSSISPALNGPEGLDRAIKMSRGWCFHSSFINSRDQLHSDIRREVFGLPEIKQSHTHWSRFYTLFNLLLLKGYNPETTYYTESSNQLFHPDINIAEHYTDHISEIPDSERKYAATKVLNYLKRIQEENGSIYENRICTYGWILWNVNQRTN